MTCKMNDKQRKTVTDNYDLIPCFMKSRHLKENDVEDWYGIVSLALCEAAMLFDESRNVEFPVFAYVVMDKAVAKAKKEHTYAESELESEYGSCSYNHYLSPMYLHEAVNQAICSLSVRDTNLLHMIIDEGLSIKQVSEKLHIAKQEAQKVHDNFLKSVYNYIVD